MTDPLDPLDPLDDDPSPARPDPTGVPRVDAVVDAVAAAGDRPLTEQVAVFEQAHAELRSTLDDPGAGDAVGPGDPSEPA